MSPVEHLGVRDIKLSDRDTSIAVYRDADVITLTAEVVTGRDHAVGNPVSEIKPMARYS